ncbi:MAG TPA: alpha/beta fold hydrolase [Chloroflexota bacterium]|nr:alpha/beta fold hydrolase [Chloroflexota bacterium]
MTQLAFEPEPFRPARGIANCHMQTVAGHYGRSQEGIIFHRWRIDTPDGDFLDLDFPEVAGYLPAEDAPLVLLLHGLEGSARSSYAYETYRQLAQRGIRSVGMNYRSCSGQINRTPYTYHAGETRDVIFVLQQLGEWFSQSALGAVGFSLGANMLLKYLGEQGGNSPLAAAAAISPPFDLGRSMDVVENGVSHFYNDYFMRALRQKMQARAPLLDGLVDIEQILAAETFRELDEALTVPLYGFADVWDYYQQSSSGRYLPAIQIPTLIIRSLDDPLFHPEDIPYADLAANPCLTAVITPHGGHVGFAEGRPGHLNWWAERQAARFLAAKLGDWVAG